MTGLAADAATAATTLVSGTWGTTRTNAQHDLEVRLPNIANVACAPVRTSANEVTGTTRIWQRFSCSGETYGRNGFRLSYAVTGRCATCWTFSHLTGVGVEGLRVRQRPMPRNPLRTVTVTSSDVVRVTFTLPPSMVPYALHFDTKSWGGLEPDHEVDLLLPGLPKGNANTPADAPVNFGTTTATTWTSPAATDVGVLLRDGRQGETTTWSVTLAYAPKATCVAVHDCPGIRRSPSLTLVTHDTMNKASTTPSPSPTATGPTYLTTGGIEEAIEQNGLNIDGVNHSTLYVGCTGQGYPGPNMTDLKFEVSEPSYDKFLCAITLAGSSVSLIHIQMGNNSYAWQAID